jgi:tetratricopeptide (TPR) repeat protein
MAPSADNPYRKLSAAMIVRDAEPLVAATLQSVADIADEIVVADTGSADDTRQVAASLASRVIDVPWQHDFAAARNACLAEVTGDWVLWLDAGETIGPVTAGRIRRFVDRQADAAAVYSLLVRVPPTPHDICDQQIARVRLVPRRAAVNFRGRVREQLNGSLDTLGLKIQPLPLVIQRPAYDQQAEVKLRKAHRNLKLADREIAELGSNARLSLARGEALALLGEPEEARDCFRRAQHEADAGSDELLEAFYGQITSLAETPAGREAQLDLCLEALQSFPVDLQLLCAMGNFLQASGRMELAIRAFETAVQCGELKKSLWHLADIEDVAVVCWAATLQLQTRVNEAQRLLEGALIERPASVRIRRQLIELHIQQQDRDQALEHVQQLPTTFPDSQAFSNAVRGACLALGGDWVAAEAYLETAYDDDCRDPICLRWLAATLLELDKATAARRVLRDWYQIEPDNEEIVQLAERLPVEAEPPEESVTTSTRTDGRQIRIHRPALPGIQSLPKPKSGEKFTTSTPSQRQRLDQ